MIFFFVLDEVVIHCN